MAATDWMKRFPWNDKRRASFLRTRSSSYSSPRPGEPLHLT